MSFQLNDFTADCKLWTTNATSHQGESLKGFAKMPSIFTAGLAKYDPFWATNDAEVSKMRYLPLRAEFKFQLSARVNENWDAFWVRLDFIAPRKVLPTSASHSLNLPDGLFSMKALLTTPAEPINTNDINSLYWRKVAKTQWVKIKAAPGEATDRSVVRHKTVNIKFPKRVINCETDTPYSYTNDTILSNVPRSTQMWCVISFDRQYTAALDFKLGIQRTMHWRDESGAAN